MTQSLVITQLLGGKSDFKIKRDINSTITEFKARFVIKDYLLCFGIDLDQIFITIVKPIIFKVFFIIANFFDITSIK